MTREIYKIIDLDCEVIIENTTRKDVLGWLDEYVENMENDWFDASDDTFEILYKDGTTDYINEEYDGHKIKKIGIESIVYNNACTSVVYGNYEINEYGVVTAGREKIIAIENIKKIA